MLDAELARYGLLFSGGSCGYGSHGAYLTQRLLDAQLSNDSGDRIRARPLPPCPLFSPRFYLEDQCEELFKQILFPFNRVCCRECERWPEIGA